MMPTRRYRLRRGETKRLAISWSSFSFPYLTIRLDGTVIGTIPTREEASTEQAFLLGDGSVLQVQLVDGKAHVSRNGQPLPDSPSDPFYALKTTSRLIFFLGGFSMVLGLFLVAPAILMVPALLLSEQITWGGSLVVNGLIFVVLGLFVRRASSLALSLVLALLTVDALILLRPGNVLTVIVYIALFIKFIQNFRVIQQIHHNTVIDQWQPSDAPVWVSESLIVSAPRTRVVEDKSAVMLSTRNQLATITYNGYLAASAESITMHWGYNNWNGITDTSMTREHAGTWQAIIAIPAGTTVLNMAFYDQRGTWDNHHGSNYNLSVSSS